MSTSDNVFSVQLAEVKCDNFFLKEKTVNEDISPEKLQIAHRVSLEVRPDIQAINVITGLKYILDNKDASEITVKCHFKVTPFSKLVNIDSTTVNFEEALVYTIVPVAFSTSRGYMIAKLEGSPFADYPYPIIQTEELLKQVKILPLSTQ